jgi:type IV pilus assembly protein PilO
MRNFPLRRNLILAGLAVLFAADVALAYFTLQLSGSQEQREQALVSESFRIARVKDDVDRAADIRKGLPDKLKRLDDFEISLLPMSKGYSVVTKELDQFSKDTHVLLDDVKFHEKEVSGRNLTELGMEVVVNGDYNGIVLFLNKLQRSKSVYIVDGLAVEPSSTGQGLKVNLHLRTYFRKA